MRFPLTKAGYKLGINALDFSSEESALISKAATILGMTVIGALIASYINIDVLATIQTAAGNTVSIQTDLLDKIMPNILPIGYTFLLFYFLRKKHVSPIMLIVVTFVLALILSLLGIL